MKPTPAEKMVILKRRKDVAELRLEGLECWEIALRLGFSVDVIEKDSQAVRKEWEKKRVEARDRWVGRELARIDAIERLARAGWLKSCQDAETRHVRTETEPGRDKDDKPIVVETKSIAERVTKGQSGDPRWLERIAWCVEQRLRIVGGYAPKETWLSGPGGRPVPITFIEVPEDAPGGPPVAPG